MDSFKNKIYKNKLKGYWSIIPSSQIHEIMGIAGFDFGIIDLEHGTYSFQQALESVIAIKESGMYALIRPSSHDEKEILRCLELGVDGLCVPHIKNVEEAKSIISFIKYPPQGIRGASGFTRATKYGFLDFNKHVINANKSIFVSLLIESIEGINNAREIANIDGVDNLYFGTYDIASSMGEVNQKGENIQNIIKKAIDNVGNNVSFGQVCVDNNQYKSLDSRIQMIVCGVDCGIILNGSKIAKNGFI